MLRLAAGGFRDMTRIAAGHPGIWPDILATNRDAVLAALDTYIDALMRARDVVASGARDDVLSLLSGHERLAAICGRSFHGDRSRRTARTGARPSGVLAEVTTSQVDWESTSPTSRSPIRSKAAGA